MKKLFTLLFGTHSPFYFLVALMMRGRLVGKDHLGNRYYQGERRKGYKNRRRWVRYAQMMEASTVPPEWHGWLHHQTDAIPNEDGMSFRKPWQKPHLPNVTGTDLAYRPKGHILAKGTRQKATGDYEAWNPDMDTPS